MGTLLEAVSIFMTISRSHLLRMRNVSDKSCREYQNTHLIYFLISTNLMHYIL